MSGLPDHLSHSQVTTFVSCPRRWHYDKVAKADRERTPACLAFGSAIHDAVAVMNEAALAGDEARDLAHLTLHSAWKSAVATTAAPLFLAADKDPADLARLGHALIDAYTPPAGIVGVEQAFEIRLADDLPPVTGRIDIVRQEGDALILADVKTSASRKIADTADLEAQLALYREAYPAERFEAIVLAKLKTPAVTVQAVTPWPRERLVNHYREVHAAMKTGVRFAARSWACDGCAFADRCRHDG